jgi:cytochrome P450
MSESTGIEVNFDPANPEFRADPYEQYRVLQRHCPVTYSDRLGQYVVSSYDLVRSVAIDHSTFSNEDTFDAPFEAKVLVTADEPAHGRQRRLVAGAFTPRRVAALEPSLCAIANDLIDRFVDTGQCDLIEDFAFPLPVIAISDLLGIPAEGRTQFRRWADDLFVAVTDPSHADAAKRSFQELSAYMLDQRSKREALLDADQKAPDDLLTGLVEAGHGDESLDDQEFVLVAMQLLTAGHETTTHLIGNAVHTLCTHLDQMSLLLANPHLIAQAIEEVLRYEAPVQGLWRRASVACRVSDVEIPQNSLVHILFAAANRDPTLWSDPDRFDITRDPQELNQHLSFGFGIHHCLGAPLARLEGRVALNALLTRLRGLRLDPSDTPLLAAPTFTRGFQRLRICWDAYA